MQAYFVVLALDGFDELKRQVGYTRTLDLLEEVRDTIRVSFPECRQVRAHRTSVEFIVRSPSKRAMAALLEKMRESLRGEIAIRGRVFARSVTLAAVPCRGSVPTEPLIKDAESALRTAQRESRSFAIGCGHASPPSDHRLMDDLNATIVGDGLDLHYQPKLRARCGGLAGAEGLVRWHHPERGTVPPDRFIPIAERSGDIRALTEWVIDRAVADQVRLARSGIAISLHVNISAPLAADPDFVEDALQRLAPAPGTIGFEITETAMIADPEGALANFRRLADAGVPLSIDDYGSGFSSLAYLQRLPVKELKIDRSFIERLSSGARDPLLVRSTIDLAHALEMEVTAEGVQSASALALLQVMGCDLVQGYFLSAPLSLAALIDYARASEGGAALPRAATLRERVAERRRTLAADAA